MQQVVDRNQIHLVNKTLSFLLDNQVGLDADHFHPLYFALLSSQPAKGRLLCYLDQDKWRCIENGLEGCKTLNQDLKDGVKEYVAKKTGEPVMDVLHFYSSHLEENKFSQ